MIFNEKQILIVIDILPPLKHLQFTTKYCNYQKKKCVKITFIVGVMSFVNYHEIFAYL